MCVHYLLIHELGSWLRRIRSHPFISTLANLTQHVRGIHTDSEKTDSMVKNKHLPETNSVCKWPDNPCQFDVLQTCNSNISML